MTDSKNNTGQQTEQQWRAQLSADEFRVCRQKGTEAPFTGKYWDCTAVGSYRCSCCGEPLFTSVTKFDAGCGWPSFFQPLSDDVIAEEVDSSLGVIRTEVMCKRCGSHLGHVFDDGPAPTGLRYCINSISLKLAEEK